MKLTDLCSKYTSFALYRFDIIPTQLQATRRKRNIKNYDLIQNNIIDLQTMRYSCLADAQSLALHTSLSPSLPPPRSILLNHLNTLFHSRQSMQDAISTARGQEKKSAPFGSQINTVPSIRQQKITRKWIVGSQLFQFSSSPCYIWDVKWWDLIGHKLIVSSGSLLYFFYNLLMYETNTEISKNLHVAHFSLSLKIHTQYFHKT